MWREINVASCTEIGTADNPYSTKNTKYINAMIRCDDGKTCYLETSDRSRLPVVNSDKGEIIAILRCTNNIGLETLRYGNKEYLFIFPRRR